MVRALKLESTSSGTYYNMSEGISDTAYNANNFVSTTAFVYTLSGTSLQVQSTAQVPATLMWDFGNGSTSTSANAATTYTANGTYVVSLIAASQCLTDTAYLVLNITETGLRSISLTSVEITAYPNPTKGLFRINLPSATEAKLQVFDASGKEVFVNEHFYGNQNIDLSDFDKGLYLVKVSAADKELQTRVMVE